ncbi:MAG: peptidylprolyl isomerase [Treponema sp.]|nr:peptidylprolyl isomerase [Treponema sp.]
MASKDKKQPERRDDSNKAEMMHRLKTRPFIFFGTIFILVIVVIAFVFVPAMVPQGGAVGDFTFGYYNRVPIRMVPGNFFHQVQQSLMRQHQMLFSEEADRSEQVQAITNLRMHRGFPGPHFDLFLGHFNAADLLMEEIMRVAFLETAIQLGIQDEMRRSGFVVPNNVVDREMARMFQTPDGRFDAAAYRSMDTATRMSEWRQLQERIAIGQYFSDLGSLRISSNEVAFIGAMASPRRSFSLAVFPLLDSYPDSEVIAFAQANPDLFRITRLSRITVNSERDAQQLLDMIQTGVTTFEEAARTNSQDVFAEMGGSMGMRMAYEFTAEIWDFADRESVINLASGALSRVVSVAAGWAIFRAEEPVQAVDTEDPLQLTRIRGHIMTNLRGMVEDWVITEAENFSAQVTERGLGEASFEEVAFEGNILRRNFGPLPVNFGDSEMFSMVRAAGVPEIQHAGRDLFFWRAAFSTPILTPSTPIVLGSNVIVLFPLEESYADEFVTGPIEALYPSRVMDYLSHMSRAYFLTNDRLDDRFNVNFRRFWGTN